MGINPLFAFSKTKKNTQKNLDAARFLDARGDEKQVINLERPYPKVITLITNKPYKHIKTDIETDKY